MFNFLTASLYAISIQHRSWDFSPLKFYSLFCAIETCNVNFPSCCFYSFKVFIIKQSLEYLSTPLLFWAFLPLRFSPFFQSVRQYFLFHTFKSVEESAPLMYLKVFNRRRIESLLPAILPLWHFCLYTPSNNYRLRTGYRFTSEV